MNITNNLKKQAKKKFYANINENLDELKSANGKLYWKTMNMLIKNENSSNETPPLHGNYIYNILFKNFNIRENIQASTIKIR
jgi:hypothetical protein